MFDVRQRGGKAVGLLAEHDLGGVGVHHDAGDVVGDDIVQLPGQGKAFASPDRLDDGLPAILHKAQDEPRAEPGRPALDAHMELAGGT